MRRCSEGGFFSEKAGFGSRVAKYKHRFCNTEFGSLKFSAQELGIVCVLLLRGPQTPGELRTRTNRLCTFADVQEVEATLERLAEREDGPFVAKLPREPGMRESRYAHLFSGEVRVPEASGTAQAAGALSIPYQTERRRILHECIGPSEQALGVHRVS